jgi:hypothetical protein
MKIDPEWVRWGRGQVNSGVERGYLYQSRQKSKRWKWKGIEFEAPTPKVAIEMLISQEVKFHIDEQ